MGNTIRRLSLLNVLAGALCAFLFPAVAGAATATTVTVECGNPKAKINTIAAGLALLPTSGASTLLVSGTCLEDVTILNFDQLTIEGNPTATIDNGTNFNTGVGAGNSFVVMSNLTITGGIGFACGRGSICRLIDVTVEDSLDSGVYFSPGTSGVLRRCTIQNNPNSDGLILDSNTVVTLAGTIIQGNGGGPESGCGTDCGGAFLASGSHLGVSFDRQGETVTPSLIQNNDAYGIRARFNSTLGVNRATISGNGTDGIQLQEGSVASVGGGVSITGNGGHALRIGDHSLAVFGAVNNLSGNALSPQVVCDGQFAATRGFGNLVGTDTNCPAEPEPVQ